MLSLGEYRQQPNLALRQPVEIDHPVTAPFAAAGSPPTQLANAAGTRNNRTCHGVQCDESSNRLALIFFKKIGSFSRIYRRFDDRKHMMRLWQCRSSRPASKMTGLSRFRKISPPNSTGPRCGRHCITGAVAYSGDRIGRVR